MSHETLIGYYRMNFAMMQHHKYSLAELEDMIPWEREVYLTLFLEWVKEEEQRIDQQQQKLG